MTKVENPAGEDLAFEIEVNSKSLTGPVVIPSGKAIGLRRDIPPGVSEVSIRYTGDKRLLILETAFQ